MESWNHIIHTALLGTDKKQLRKEELPEELSASIDLVLQNTIEKEDAFLQSAALLYNFRQCGVTAINKESVSIHKAATEEKEYANYQAHQVLQDIITIESTALLNFWLQQCIAKQKIVEPEFIPVLMNTAISNKELQDSVFNCCGKRGEWLAGFNEEWKPALPLSEEELWQTGTLEQRKNVLLNIRKSSPDKARQMIQDVWSQENAGTKTELLKQISQNAGADDIEWLDQLQSEKSQKVKDLALEILKSIPSSTIVSKYQEILKASVKLVHSKGLLGIGSKTLLEIHLATDIDETVYKSGIEKLSSDKKITDEDFIIYQLISATPPAFWQEHVHSEINEVIRLFSKDEKSKRFITALGLASMKFKNVDWIRAIIKEDEKEYYHDALFLLPQAEAEQYALSFLEQDDIAGTVISQLKEYSKEWSLPVSRAVLKQTGKIPYQYNKGFYNGIIHLLPIPVAGELEKFTPKDEHLRSMWSNLSDHITKLLSLKLQTLKAFNE